jgi:hypothetical protein
MWRRRSRFPSKLHCGIGHYHTVSWERKRPWARGIEPDRYSLQTGEQIVFFKDWVVWIRDFKSSSARTPSKISRPGIASANTYWRTLIFLRPMTFANLSLRPWLRAKVCCNAGDPCLQLYGSWTDLAFQTKVSSFVGDHSNLGPMMEDFQASRISNASLGQDIKRGATQAALVSQQMQSTFDVNVFRGHSVL